MKDVIVVSPITERRGMLDEYEDQLAAAGIDFHLEAVQLADGINSMTARWKFGFLKRMCERFGEYSRIIFTDAWDVLFFGSKEELLEKIPALPIMSAERNCWPENDLNFKQEIPGPWRYYNAGMVAGCPLDIFTVVSNLLHMDDLDIMEQAWMNRQLARGRTPFSIDSRTELFYTVSFDREDGSLQTRDGKLWNLTTGTCPQFFHFSGKCSSAPFRAMLREGESLGSGLCAVV